MSIKFYEAHVLRIRELYEELGNATEVAKILTEEFGKSVSRQAVSYWINSDTTPLSEDDYKIKECGRDECIRILKRIAEDNPEKVVTRNFFRNNSPLAESAWSKHFGTFEEFKKASGIKLTRHARKMELNLAKHASIDNYRALNDQKRDWDEAYLKPSGSRFQTILVGSDIHDIECDPFWRFMFLEAAQRVQPETICLNGDMFDLPEFGKYGTDPREWDVVGRIQWVHTFLRDLRNICPDAEIVFVEGNHEYRLLRHLAEATPAMQAILSDLHGFTVPKLLGLEEFEINYVAPADLATFTKSDQKAEIRKNWHIFHDFIVGHHFPEGRTFGLPGWNGHHHSHLVYTDFNPMQGSFEWHQIGSGHKPEASYCNGNKWGMGFLLAHVDTVEKHVQFEYTDVGKDHCVLGGKWYQRND